jgi:hypothetical protein
MNGAPGRYLTLPIVSLRVQATIQPRGVPPREGRRRAIGQSRWLESSVLRWFVRSLRDNNKNANSKAKADPCGMTTKRQGQRQRQRDGEWWMSYIPPFAMRLNNKTAKDGPPGFVAHSYDETVQSHRMGIRLLIGRWRRLRGHIHDWVFVFPMAIFLV